MHGGRRSHGQSKSGSHSKHAEGKLNSFVFRRESVNGNALFVKGKVHCLRQPLTESNGQNGKGTNLAFPFVSSSPKGRINKQEDNK